MTGGNVLVPLRRLGVKAVAFGATDLLIGTSPNMEFAGKSFMP